MLVSILWLSQIIECGFSAQILAKKYMRHYLFFINHLYAYSILRPLQKAIRKRGDDVAWFVQGVDDSYLRADEKQFRTVDEVKKYNPVAVFVPGNWVPDFFPGTKVEIFHGLANDETGKKGHYRIRELFDLYCTHAPTVTEKFQKLSEKHKTFSVTETGWPKLDPLFNAALRDSSPYDNFKSRVSPDKPVVFYASTFSPSLTSAPYLIEKINELSADTKWHWLVTLHPKMPEEIVAQYKAMESDNFTFVDSSNDVLPLLKAADVMLCDTSSIALEYLLLDKPLVTYRTKAPGPHVVNVSDVDDLESSIEYALTKPADLLAEARDYVKELHAYNDGESSQRVLEAVDMFIEKNVADKLDAKPLNLWRKLQMRKRMGYYRLK